MSFLIVGWTSILHIFTVRSRKSMFRRTIKDNPKLALSAAAMIVLFALLVLIPPAAWFFGMTALSLEHWLIAIGLSLVPTITAELGKLIKNGCERTSRGRRLVRHTVEE